ncbi:MAG TPA: MFS transporter [Anaerolineae bacterium]|nr:MFS transporter [Anaerolineae bacterium]
MSKRYAWIVMAALFVAAIAVSINQYKVPPVMPVLMQVFGLDLTMANLLMSIFSLSGFLLAIPAGIVVHRIGPKRSGLVAVGAVIIGAGLGAISSGAAALLASRTVEGLSFVFMMVVGPALVSLWFSPEERGVPMGVFATWVPVGSLIILNAAPALESAFGWQSVWWFGCLYGVFGFLVFWALVRLPTVFSSAPANPGQGGAGQGSSERLLSSVRTALANRNVWLLGLLFFCFTMVFPGFSNNMPTYLHTVRGYSLGQAALIVSLSSLATIVGCPLMGLLSDRIGSRKKVYTAALLIVAVLWLFPYHLTGVAIPLFLMVFGLVGGAIPTMIFASLPEVMERPELAGIGMGGVVTLQNLGLLIGPVMFGRIVQVSGNWALAGYAMIPITLLAVLVGWLVDVR